MCPHTPTCPSADRPDHRSARLVAFHPSQGWGRLCNGVIVFDDAGELLPDGRAVPPPAPTRGPVVIPLAGRRRRAGRLPAAA